MTHFICPVCGAPLIRNEKTYDCGSGHCYNIAKSGYVNLLLSRQSGKKRHGDDKMMVRCRKAFLEKGYYRCLLDALLSECRAYGAADLHILDLGCGEGWYSENILHALRADGRRVQMEGVDISKDALLYAAKRDKDIAWAVASSVKLPIGSQSVDILLNLFAPMEEREADRVLKKGGRLIRTVTLEKHLWGLKEKIYDAPYENRPIVPDLPGFSPPKRIDVRSTLVLTEKEDIENLFKMTPYYYKTSVRDQQKLENLQTLTTPLEFAVLVYEKK